MFSRLVFLRSHGNKVFFNGKYKHFFRKNKETPAKLAKKRKSHMLKSLFKKNAVATCAVCRFLVILQLKIIKNFDP